MSRYTNNRDVYLCTVSSGRSNLKIADTMGMFVNTLALGLNIDDVTVGKFLKHTSDTFDQTLRHEDYPFARIASDYGFRPAIAYAYQVGVLSHFAVNGVSESQEEELSDLRQTAAGEAPSTLFHECIGHFAQTQPDHEALVATDGRYTYREMDQVTSRIAAALRRRLEIPLREAADIHQKATVRVQLCPRTLRPSGLGRVSVRHQEPSHKQHEKPDPDPSDRSRAEKFLFCCPVSALQFRIS